ncbi:MAG TPA: hypothetical protein VJU16_05305, partial [Planctomycetota bacterium]|nr:hypothetical protein [Planctomycetota bacterium]
MRPTIGVLIVLLASCGDSATPPSTPPTAPPVEVPLRTGTIEGFVRVGSDDVAPLLGTIRGF